MKHIFYFFLVALFIVGCGNVPQSPIQLNDLSDDISVKKLGQRLIDLPYGLNALEPSEEEAQEIFIAVHGGSSEGMSGSIPSKQLTQNRSICTFIAGPIMDVFKVLQKH